MEFRFLVNKRVVRFFLLIFEILIINLTLVLIFEILTINLTLILISEALIINLILFRFSFFNGREGGGARATRVPDAHPPS